MTNGINALFKANGVVGIQGHGRLLPGNKVSVKGADGSEKTLEAKNVILASGSDAHPLAIRAARRQAHRRFLECAGVRCGPEAPRRHRRRRHRPGARQRVAPARQRSRGARSAGEFLPMVDQTIAKEAQRHFKKQGLDIKLGAKVLSAAVSGDAVDVVYTRRAGRAFLAGRQARGGGRTPSLHRRIAGGRHRSPVGRARVRRGRRALPHRRAQRLGNRRCGARPDACAQGQGGGRDGRRSDRRPLWRGELQGDSLGDLHRSPKLPGSGRPRNK